MNPNKGINKIIHFQCWRWSLVFYYFILFFDSYKMDIYKGGSSLRILRQQLNKRGNPVSELFKSNQIKYSNFYNLEYYVL